MRYILYKKKPYRKISLSIKPSAEFNDILLTLNSLRFEGCEHNEEQIIFAILELINNSLRAHREKNISHNIMLQFEVDQNTIYITLRDRGGGFNPNNLPYDLYEEPENIDTNNEVFHQYRAKFNYLRFGIGLYVVKKTFQTFELSFLDERLNKVTWDSGKAAGTCVELSIGNNDE